GGDCPRGLRYQQDPGGHGQERLCRVPDQPAFRRSIGHADELRPSPAVIGTGPDPFPFSHPRPMSRIRALAKESMVYGISSIVGRFLNFLLVPFYTHVLAPADSGISYIIFAVIAFLNIIYQFGFDSAYLRLSMDAGPAGQGEAGGRRRDLFSTAFWSQAAGTILFSALLLAAANPLGELLLIPEASRVLFLYAAGILLLDTL